MMELFRARANPDKIGLNYKIDNTNTENFYAYTKPIIPLI